MAAREKPDYKELVAEAETAVAAVKDPELRRAAFEKILEQLLGQGQPTRPSPRAANPPSTPSKALAKEKTARPGPRGYIEDLINDGFFAHQKTIAEVKAELANRGHHVPLTGLSGPLQKLCQARRLRRQKKKGRR